MASVNTVVKEFERERAQMREDAQKTRELEVLTPKPALSLKPGNESLRPRMHTRTRAHQT
jgi:hypothetical protein